MIVLIGFMGSGKTVVGQALARRMNVPFADLDEAIARRAGRSITEIFDEEGEGAFRDLEKTMLEEALGGPSGVVSAGGGVVDEAANRIRLGREIVVFLDVSLEDALARIGDRTIRPMLRRVDPAALLARRRPRYESVADVTIDTDGRTIEEIVDEIAVRVGPGGSP